MERERMGIVLNEVNAWASAPELDDLGALWVRSLVIDLDHFAEVVDELPQDVNVIALINSQAIVGPDPTDEIGSELAPDWADRWTGFINRFADRFRGPDRRMVVECLNEWDIAERPPDIAVAAARMALPILEGAGIGCLLGSVAGSDWVNQLGRAVQQLSDDERARMAGVCFHPYQKHIVVDGVRIPDGWPDSVGDAVHQACITANPPGLPNLQVWVTEFGLNRRDVGDSVEQQSNYLRQAYCDLAAFSSDQLAVACWFCWNDRSGVMLDDGTREQYGLRPEDDNLPPYATRQAFVDSAFAPDCAPALVGP